MKDSFNGRATAINESIKNKVPGIHSKTSSSFGYLKGVWQETFPNEDAQAKAKI